MASATAAVVHQMPLPYTTTGPIYHQRQAGTERSDVAARKFKKKVVRCISFRTFLCNYLLDFFRVDYHVADQKPASLLAYILPKR